MLTIWGRTNSINVQKVLWCCDELGLAYSRIDVGRGFGCTDTAEYLALNPNGLVPTLDDDGFVLWESNAIVRYLSARYGEGTLCPTEPRERFGGESWMDWQATTLWPALRPLFLGLVRTPLEDRRPEVLETSQGETERALRILDARLAEQAFAGGPRFTMADIPVGVTAHRWFALDIRRPDLPCLKRWYDELTERPAFQRHVMKPLS